jgi:hypothetical protein
LGQERTNPVDEAAQSSLLLLSTSAVLKSRKRPNEVLATFRYAAEIARLFMAPRKTWREGGSFTALVNGI